MHAAILKNVYIFHWYIRHKGWVFWWQSIKFAKCNCTSSSRLVYHNDKSSLLTETEISGSKVGVRAQDERNRTEPTMWLNLKHGGDEYKKHLVVHEFGHALGLEHEHQRGDLWKLIGPYVNEDVMRNDPRIGGAFERYTADPRLNSNVPGHVQTDYDPSSVMHYWWVCMHIHNTFVCTMVTVRIKDPACSLYNVHVYSL